MIYLQLAIEFKKSVGDIPMEREGESQEMGPMHRQAVEYWRLGLPPLPLTHKRPAVPSGKSTRRAFPH